MVGSRLAGASRRDPRRVNKQFERANQQLENHLTTGR
jgi:hypothetical protein